MKIEITDKEIEAAFKNTDFGGLSNEHILKYGLLKCACGYHQGFTATAILHELNLIDEEYVISPKGRLCLWKMFREETNI